MKFSISAQDLKNTLTSILGVVDKKSVRPILSNCLLEVTNNEISFYATDLEISGCSKIQADVESGGNFCINAKNLFDITRELPEDKVTFETAENKNALNISCGEIQYCLNIISPDEFPQLNFTHTEKPFEVQPNTLLKIINKTFHAISSDETRGNLNGIYLQVVDSRIRAVATDGHVLAMTENEPLSINKAGTLENGVIIPRKGISELKKICESYSSKNLLISVDETFMYLTVGDQYFLSVRLIARDYPKYQTVIPKKTSFRMSVDKSALQKAVKRIKILANEKSNAVKLSFNADNLLISANHPALGDAQEKIPVKYDGKNLEIGFNAKYLLDTFSALEDEEVHFEFNNEFSPVIIKSNNSSEFLGIVMPLRL